MTALAQLLERGARSGGRRALLDHAVGLLRHDVERGELDIETLRALVSLLSLRERPRAAAAVCRAGPALTGSGDAAVAPRAARSPPCAAPRSTSARFRPGCRPGIRQIMRLRRSVPAAERRRAGPAAGPARRCSRATASDGARGRGPCSTPSGPSWAPGSSSSSSGRPPPASGPVALRAEPGSPAAVIIGAPIVALGPAAVRFAAARTLRLAATNLDAILAVPPEEAAALLVGIIRQFVPDFLHPAVRDALVDSEAARAARLIPRKIKPAAAPFAIESAGPFDVAALHAAVRDGANATGLLASADLPAALSVILAVSGMHDQRAGAVTDRRQPGGPGAAAFCGLRRYDDLAAAMDG